MARSCQINQLWQRPLIGRIRALLNPTLKHYSLWRIFMASERTLSIIKPDAVAKNVVGQILGRFETAGLHIVACKMMHLSREQAEGFYA
jgi:hypothetical protein